MRNTLNAIDPLPEFPSDGLSFELQDSEPAYQPCERHKRLPSYREVCEARGKAKWLRAVMQDCARNGITSWDSKQLYFQLDAFNGNCNPEITEADCRKRKDAPAEQPKQSTDAPQFKVGDRVRVIADCSFSGVEARIVGIDTLISIEWGVRGARSDARVRASSLELLPTEPAPQEPQADAGGWVSWNPSTQGRPPLPADARVALRVDDGSVVWAHGLRVDSANWAPDSIIRAFRIVA
jgi:hypothetical protein